MIVLKDADVERAASSAAFGKFLNSGQICMALNRIIVERPVYDAFIKAFVDKASQIKYGDPRKKDVVVGPLINHKQVERIQNLIDQSIEQGARYALRGKVEGNVIAPTILSDVAWPPAFSDGEGKENGGPTLAALAKKYGQLPVMANGNLHDPEKANEMIEKGEADVVTIGRGALANSDWVNKVKNGETLEEFVPEKFLHPNAKIKDFET